MTINQKLEKQVWAHVYTLSTWEAEAGEWQVGGQPVCYIMRLSAHKITLERPPSGYCPWALAQAAGLRCILFISLEAFYVPTKKKNPMFPSFFFPLVPPKAAMLGASSNVALWIFLITHFCAQLGSPAIPASGQLSTVWVCFSQASVGGHSYCFQYLLAANSSAINNRRHKSFCSHAFCFSKVNS